MVGRDALSSGWPSLGVTSSGRPMPDPPGLTWIVAQRDVGRVAGHDKTLVATIILDLETRLAPGTGLEGSSRASAARALAMALDDPAKGTPVGPPTRLLAPASIAAEVGGALRDVGLSVAVELWDPDDQVIDVLDSLTHHLAGRTVAGPMGEPESWATLHAQAAAYARAQPWDGIADSVPLLLELRVGARRTEMTAVVLGNSGIERGLMVTPGRGIPEEIAEGRPGARLRDGSLMLLLGAPDKMPPVFADRPHRYGWPDDLEELPTFSGWAGGGAHDITESEIELLTVALAGVVEFTRSEAGKEVRGQLLLPRGSRGRYRVRRWAEPTQQEGRELRLFAGPVRDDLVPAGSEYGLGMIPWAKLDLARKSAGRHLAPPAGVREGGDGLPVVVIAACGAVGRRAAERIAASRPYGVLVAEHEGRVHFALLTEEATFAVGVVDPKEPALALYRERVTATDGWRALLLPDPKRREAIHGLFEFQLRQPPEHASRQGG